MSKSKLPTVSSQIPNDLRMFLDRVREVLSRSGSDRFVTLDELKRSGVVETRGDDIVNEEDRDDGVFIPVLGPPKPTGLEVSGAIEYMTLTWDTPTYYGHASTEVWRSETNDLSAATQQYQTDANVVSDLVGPGQTRYYWVRFVNINGVKGPFSDVAFDNTGYDVPKLLEALTDSITKGQLVSTFSNTVSNIEGEYIIKADTNGVASGFGFVSTATPNGGATSEFGVFADRFFVLPAITFNQSSTPYATASGQVWKDGSNFYVSQAVGYNDWEPLIVPFAVQTTPTTTTNGDLIPAGVYMNQAMIKNASITNAKIKDLAVDEAKIKDLAVTDAKVGDLKASKITTGRMQSYNFNNSPGYAGWLLDLGTTQTTMGGQEDVAFILRSAGLSNPAFQLLNGTVTINGLAVRDKLESVNYSTSSAGFQFDIDNNTYTLRGTGGQILLTSGGLENQAVKDAINTELDNLQNAVDTAQSTADGAVTPTELGTELADKLDVTEFNTLEGNLKAMAFLDKITPANVGTYMESAAITTAYIGNLAVGTAKIASTAITEAKIGSLAVSEAKIQDLAVDTLKIADDAVTVPDYLQANGGTVSVGFWSEALKMTVNWPGELPRGVVVVATVSFLHVGGGSDPTFEARLTRQDSTSVDLGGNTSTGAHPERPASITVVGGFAPQSSTEDYRIQIKGSQVLSGEYQLGNKSILVLGVKK